jgi:DNA polymerase III subunit epsilon
MRRRYPGHESYSLANLTDIYGIDLKDHHRFSRKPLVEPATMSCVTEGKILQIKPASDDQANAGNARRSGYER